MQTKLERYAAKYGEAFMNELPDIIRTYCLANDLRVPTKKRPSNLHIIRVIAEATSEVLGIPIENIYSKSRLRPLVIARSIIADLNVKGIMRGFAVVDQKRMKAFLNDPENRFLRTRPGRI